jgi:hypothetical protein
VQTPHHCGEQERRDLEVEHRPDGAGNLGGDPSVGVVVGEVALHVRQASGEPVEAVRVELLASAFDGRASPLDELVGGPLVAGDADDGTVDKPAAFETVERSERHDLRGRR